MATEAKFLTSSVSGAWNSPSNANGAADGACADSGSTEDGDVLHIWQITDFTIPAGSTINGFEAEVEYSAKEDDLRIEISPTNSPWGTSKTLPQLAHGTPGCSAAEINTVGSSSDLWGSSWTPATINDGLFVRLTGIAGNEGKEVYCDYVQITCHFTEAGAPGQEAGFMGPNF
jgi:hypothetical protein